MNSTLKPLPAALALLIAAAALPCRADDKPIAPATLAAEPALPDPTTALAGIDAVITKALADQKIPGAAVAVIVNDKIVLLKGYGLRSIESNLPFTPDTIIPIASVTKQFTVAGLGTLVRQGKLDWDKPVRDYMPDFRVGDDYATLKATPRDLVTHRIGMPRHDALWFGTTLDREGLFKRLQHLGFSYDIRTRFQYNNLMFMTAGLLAGRLSGTTWEQFTKDAVFAPLNMSRSNFSLKETEADADHASGYQLDNDRKIVPDPHESAEAAGPAGSINSTARDMANYARMMLAAGTFDGKRVLDEQDVQAMMQPQMPIGPSPFDDVMSYRSYGMGLFVHVYRGNEVAEHGGNMPGAATEILFVPKNKIGVVVLTNRSGAVLRDGLPYEIVDRLLALPSARMIERNAELETKGFAQEDAAKSAGANDQRPNTKPSHDLPDYAGRYNHPGYGDVDITLANNALKLTYNGFSAPLNHWHYDLFQAPEDRVSRLDRARVQFITDLAGDISSIALPLEPRLDPIIFKRVAPPEMLERAFLTRFTGTYDFGGIDASVNLRENGTLEVVVLGRGEELVPVRGTTFRMKNRTGATLEFLAGEDGKTNRVAVFDNGSNTIAPRKP
jgi:CubicO group peptidase (beta-lactamase class C family)